MRCRAAAFVFAGTCSLLLAGCEGFSADAGMASLSQRVVDAIGFKPSKLTTKQDFIRVRDQVAQLLRAPLTADTAVQIAVANNRGLQARYGAIRVR